MWIIICIILWYGLGIFGCFLMLKEELVRSDVLSVNDILGGIGVAFVGIFGLIYVLGEYYGNRKIYKRKK